MECLRRRTIVMEQDKKWRDSSTSTAHQRVWQRNMMRTLSNGGTIEGGIIERKKYTKPVTPTPEPKPETPDEDTPVDGE